MFVLALLEDVIRLPPHVFRKEHHQAIRDGIDIKYANRVLPQVGLCICTFDLTEVHEPLVAPGEGEVRVKVQFRMVVFRPFRGEVLVGKIRSCTPEGINASVEFFSDIFIPKNLLPEGSEFNEQEQLWVWKFEDGEIFMDLEEEIRMRVVQEQFYVQPPTTRTLFHQQTSPGQGKAPNASVPGVPPPSVVGVSVDAQEILGNSEKKAPYSLVCAINDPGLGCPAWWETAEPEEEEGEEPEEEEGEEPGEELLEGEE